MNEQIFIILQINILQRFFSNSFFSTIVATILATLIATFLINMFNKVYIHTYQKKELIRSIQDLYIGSNKEWIDSKLGYPTFTNQAEKFLECVYVTNIAAIRVYYDNSAKACQAFFVTALSKKHSNSIKLPSQYSWIVSKKKIGKFSFYDIEDSPMSYFGFVSNGIGRALYGEEYTYQGSGNNYIFYFLILDYGIMKSFKEFDRNLSNSIEYGDKPIDDKIRCSSYNGYSQRITNRKIFCPNTYGISKVYVDEKIIINAITSYHSFDSLQLRSKIGNTYGEDKKMKRVIVANVKKLLYLTKKLFLTPYNEYNNYINKNKIKRVLSFNNKPVKIYLAADAHMIVEKRMYNYISFNSLERIDNILNMFGIINQKFSFIREYDDIKNEMCIGGFWGNITINMYFNRFFNNFQYYCNKEQNHHIICRNRISYSKDKTGFKINEYTFFETRLDKIDYAFLIKITPNDFKGMNNKTIHILFGGTDIGTIKATEFLSTQYSEIYKKYKDNHYFFAIKINLIDNSIDYQENIIDLTKEMFPEITQ